MHLILSLTLTLYLWTFMLRGIIAHANVDGFAMLRMHDDYEEIIVTDVDTPENMTFSNPQPKPPVQVSASQVAEFELVQAVPKPKTKRNRQQYYDHERRRRQENQAASDSYWDTSRRKQATGFSTPQLSAEALAKLGINVNIQPLALMDTPDAGVVSNADVDSEPYSAYGKLYFTDYMNREFECTGAYVDPYVVLTAAHCVYDADAKQFHHNYMFFQKFRDGSGTRRRVKKTLLFNGWYNKDGPGFGYDYAFLAMKDPSIAGNLELETSETYGDWYCVGYPSNYYRGRRLQTLHGYKGRISNSVVETAVNPMGQGCSGGAWFVQKDKNRYAAVGVNSFSIEGKDSMFSPRFKETAQKKLFERAKQLAGAD